MEDQYTQEDLDEIGRPVEIDAKTNAPKIIGKISREFDKGFSKRYLDFYQLLATDYNKALSQLRDDPVSFIEYCCRTISRNKNKVGQGAEKISILCFELFESQKQAVRDLHDARENDESAVFLKSRQQGATWIVICYAFWRCVFRKGESIVCTSKDDKALHNLGDTQSLLEKFVFLHDSLHPYLRNLLIHKFEYKTNFFAINDAVIRGHIGSDPGRSSTITMSINDEFAYNDNAKTLVPSLASCCDCNIFISTKRNPGDEYDKLLNGPMRKIRLYWRDDPQILDKEAYKKRYIDNFGLHNFNVEMEMLYSDDDLLLIFNREMLDEVKLLRAKTKPEGPIIAGFDVAGMGSDFNVIIVRQGHSLPYKDKWNKSYASASVDRLIEIYYELEKKRQGFDILIFDEIGVGYSIASEFYRRVDTLPFMVQGVSFNANAGEKSVRDDVLDEEDREVYFNLRSKLHFHLRNIIENTHGNANVHNQSELLYLHDEEIIKEMYNIPQDEKSVRKMKVVAKAEIRKLLGYSPNHLDALLMTYAADKYLAYAEIQQHLYGGGGNRL
jgi:hypothetical protein